MKNIALVTVFGLAVALGATSHAGYRLDLDQTKTICLPNTHSSSAVVLQEVTNSAVATLKAACEDHPGAVGALSTLESVEIQKKKPENGECGFGYGIKYEYHVTAGCYIP